MRTESIIDLYFYAQVTVCKPATSKSGNSEVYTVCSGYTAPLSRDGLFSLFSAVCGKGLGNNDAELNGLNMTLDCFVNTD